MTDTVLARVASLASTPYPELRKQWRELFGADPPGGNRSYIERRLAYRLQEIEFGGLKPEVEAKLDALARSIEGGRSKKTSVRADNRPIAGTRLVREWQGKTHTVTVCTDGYEYTGRRYRSLSAIARQIAGTRWNGPLFFGLRGGKGR